MRDARAKRQLATGNRNWTMKLEGSQNPLARLKDEHVLDIRYLAAQGMPQTLLGYIYGIHRNTIGSIVRGKAWTHLPLVVEGR
jgi:hypothetical protein